MKPIDLSPFDYVLDKEKDDENATVFKLKPMTGMASINLGFLGREKGEGHAIHQTLKKHLIGWENFGNNEPFDTDMDKNISKLDRDTIISLFNEISRVSGLTEEEEKNL